jgi:hypothetical protein
VVEQLVKTLSGTERYQNHIKTSISSPSNPPVSPHNHPYTDNTQPPIWGDACLLRAEWMATLDLELPVDGRARQTSCGCWRLMERGTKSRINSQADSTLLIVGKIE